MLKTIIICLIVNLVFLYCIRAYIENYIRKQVQLNAIQVSEDLYVQGPPGIKGDRGFPGNQVIVVEYLDELREKVISYNSDDVIIATGTGKLYKAITVDGEVKLRAMCELEVSEVNEPYPYHIWDDESLFPIFTAILGNAPINLLTGYVVFLNRYRFYTRKLDNLDYLTEPHNTFELILTKEKLYARIKGVITEINTLSEINILLEKNSEEQ